MMSFNREMLRTDYMPQAELEKHWEQEIANLLGRRIVVGWPDGTCTPGDPGRRNSAMTLAEENLLESDVLISVRYEPADPPRPVPMPAEPTAPEEPDEPEEPAPEEPDVPEEPEDLLVQKRP